MSDPREIEIKLDIDRADVADLRTRVLPNIGTTGATERLVSVYYDTPDLALRGHGMTLRVRVTGAGRVQTVKAAPEAGAGLFDRLEWETAIEGDSPDFDALADTPAARVLAKAKGPLGPLFETVVDRTVWQVETADESIELALDEGEVSGRGQRQPISEVELELKRGQPGALFDVLRELNEVASLRLAVSSKSERGFALIEGKTAKPAKAVRVALEPGMTTAAAFQAVMHACIRQFRLNEPLLLQARLPEALHQARVAMRRLRSALSLFKPVIADDGLESLKERLRAVSRDLGEARNLDVYLSASARPEAQENGSAPGVLAFVAELEARRRAAYDRLIARLQSGDFCRLMLELFIWIEAGPWLAPADPLRRADREQRVEVFAAALLDERRRKVKRKGRHLDTLAPEARHRVRIQAKKLRYAADFFGSLAVRPKDKRRHAAFIEAMADLQQHLGDLNDIETGHELALSFAGEGASVVAPVPDAAFAAGHVSGGQDARADRLVRAAVEAHGDVIAAKPFWRGWPGRREQC